MLPNFLVPSYKQYKTDSDSVATWLANAAHQCGYSKDLLTYQAASQQKAPKLSGTAKSIARQAGQSKPSSSRLEASELKTTPQGPKYLIAIKDFIPLAEWIVSSKKVRVEVPASFVSVLDRAITVRKRHHHWWYEKNDNGKTGKEATQSHGYFIGVLEKVREILRPRMPTVLLKDPLVQPVEGSPAWKESTTGHVLNLFENLKIEEPSNTFLNSGSISSGQKPIKTPHVQFGVDRVPDLEEVYFAIHCLFNDFDNIRRYLQQVWTCYKQGIFDLIAASITTNTALDFVKGLQEDFVDTFPGHTDFEKHINVLYATLCFANGQDPGFKERSDDDMNFAVYENAEATLFPAYLLLSSFTNVLEPNNLPTYKPDHWGVYDASSDRASKSSRDKYQEDKIVLLEILPDFCVFALGNASVRIPAEDEMTRGVCEMVRQKAVPIWLAFAAQVFLDVHHVLREQITSGFEDLVKSARYVENNIRQVLKFHENLRIVNWPEPNDQCLWRIVELIKMWVKTDIVESVRISMCKRSGFKPPPAKPFLFLKHHPLYCGLLSYYIKASVQEVSITFVNAWGSIFYCAHLYNALRQERLITKEWPDMDLALLMHRTEDVFVGDFPKTVEDYFKRFALAMGYSASMLAKNRRQTRVVASKAGPRTLNDISPVCRMFKERYCGDEHCTNLSLDSVDTILKKCLSDGDGIDSEELSEWTAPKIKINVPEDTPATLCTDRTRHSKSRNRPRKTEVSATTGIRPIQLLNALLEAIQSEIPELTFNHFRLHTVSWRLLRDIKQAIDPDLRKYYGPMYIEQENQLPFVVGYIFMTAVQSTRLAGVLMPKMKDVVSSQMLFKSAEVVEKMLETGLGCLEILMLKKALGMEVEMIDLLDLARSRSASNDGDV